MESIVETPLDVFIEGTNLYNFHISKLYSATPFAQHSEFINADNKGIYPQGSVFGYEFYVYNNMYIPSYSLYVVVKLASPVGLNTTKLTSFLIRKALTKEAFEYMKSTKVFLGNRRFLKLSEEERCKLSALTINLISSHMGKGCL